MGGAGVASGDRGTGTVAGRKIGICRLQSSSPLLLRWNWVGIVLLHSADGEQ